MDRAKKRLVRVIVQICIGVFIIIGYIGMLVSGETNMQRWTVGVILALALIATGIMGIADYIKYKKQGGK